MNAVKVAVVGAGFFGRYHARVFSESPLCKLVAIVDKDAQLGKKAADDFSVKYYQELDDLLSKEDVDAVSIVTPEQTHKELAVKCMNAGKHVIVEKPIAHTLEDAVEMVNCAKKNKVKFTVGFILRFDARYAQGKKIVEDGKIGDLVSIFARRMTTLATPLRVAMWSHPIFYMGIHDLDMMLWYNGMKRAKSVYAATTSKVLKDYNAPDVLFAVIKFENDVIGNLEVNWIQPNTWPYGLESRFDVSGTKGSLNVGIHGMGLEFFTPDEVVFPDTYHWPIVNNRLIGDLKEELNSFIECIIHDKTPLVTGEEAVKSLEIALAIKKSINEERIIKL
ncbi:MAG: Gfo/Idh/MocA family oxidoreductase [Candidatus Bathyarchaeia archaeon]